MNSKLSTLLAALLPIFALSGVEAADPLAAVPNPGRWTVRLEKPADPAAKESQPPFEVSREVWVLGPTRYEVTTWSDNHQSQLFITNNIGFEKSAKNDDVYILDPNIGAPAPPSVTEWREFSWIKPELSKGQTTYAKKDCVLYEEQTETNLRRAWIDAETRLPVALSQDGRVYLYAFEEAPKKLPSIDAVIGGARQGYEAAGKKLSVDRKPR